MSGILWKAKDLFEKKVSDYWSDPYNLIEHIWELERWTNYLCNRYKEADREIVLLWVYLHDIGHYPLPCEIDHAVRSEEIAKDFLTKEKYDEEKTKKVLHVVRAHRCADVIPESLEAKILAFCDSASHMTWNMYFPMCKDDEKEAKEFRVVSKIERDFRDLDFFPEIKKEIEPLYKAWKNLIEEYSNFSHKF